MNISYEEIGQVVVTCMADETVQAGSVVCMAENDKVSACTDGQVVCGVALHVSGDGYAAVQIKGMVSLPCTDTGVKPGLMKIVAQDGTSVKAAAGETGREVLVMNVKNNVAVVCL